MIGGAWRSRRIRFEPAPGVRPTPDRVRETLFNWLQPRLADAHCLDLFAGSGALGLEALSRGAARAVLVDADRTVAARLRAVADEFGAGARAEIVCADAFAYLRGVPRPFDVVFLDPPYAEGWLGGLCTLLDAGRWLAADARIYLESAASDAPPALPSGWSCARETRAGAVRAQLVKRAAPAAPPDHDDPATNHGT